MAIKSIGLALIGNKIYPVNTIGNGKDNVHHHHPQNLTEYETEYGYQEKEENMPKSIHYNQYPFLTDGLTDSDEVSNDINDVRIISNINSGSTSSEDEGEQNSNDHSYIDNKEYEDNSSKFGYYLEGWDYTNNDEENENELDENENELDENVNELDENVNELYELDYDESDYDESDESDEDEELDYDELELIMKKILACENDSSDENLEYSDDETETEDED
ncbi:17419_t:CDS:2, partial [Entrophospora sp. SA101]